MRVPCDSARVQPGNRLIVALDVATRAQAEDLLRRLEGVPSWVKIGLELFTAVGPAIVEEIAAKGTSVMLDLKLHDIPETVARATASVARLGASLCTVHAAGGRAMLEAAVAGAGNMKILAVTVLTSLDERDLANIGAMGPMSELVVKRAQLAMDALLRSLAGTDAALIVATHDPEVARRLQFVWRMDHGQLSLPTSGSIA